MCDRMRTCCIAIFFLLFSVAFADVTVNQTTYDLSIKATTLVIFGTGFSDTPTDNTVALSVGTLTPTCTVTVSTETQLTCTSFTVPAGNNAGALNAIVTVNGNGVSPRTQVANLVAQATITVANTNADLARHPAALTISGSNFQLSNPNPSLPVTVTMSSGSCDVVIVESTTIVCNVVLTQAGLNTGPLLVTVIANGGASAQKAYGNVGADPIITPASFDLAENANRIIVHGSGFSSTNPMASNVRSVVLTQNSIRVTCSSPVFTATAITCTLTTIMTPNIALQATVTNNGNTTIATTIATVKPAPVAINTTYDIAADATILKIRAQNVVSNNLSTDPGSSLAVNITDPDGANIVCNSPTVISTDSISQISIISCTRPTLDSMALGPNTVVISISGGNSGPTTQFDNAVVIPTPAVQNVELAASAPYLSIIGSYFVTSDPDPTNPLSVFVSWGTSPTVACPSLYANFSLITCNAVGLGFTIGAQVKALIQANGGSSDPNNKPIVATIINPPLINTTVYDLAISSTVFSIQGNYFTTPDPPIGAIFAVNLWQSESIPTCNPTNIQSNIFTCSETSNLTLGTLYATVTANGGLSGSYPGPYGQNVAVANIVPDPLIGTVDLYDISVSAEVVTIRGNYFLIDPNTVAPGNSPVVALSQPGSTPNCTVTFANASIVVCDVTGDTLEPTLNLTAIVFSNGAYSPLGVVGLVLPLPQITATSHDLAESSPLLTIMGSGFQSQNPPPDATTFVNLTQAGANPTCNIVYAIPTMVVCQVSGLGLGNITAQVTYNGGTSTTANTANVLPPPSVNEIDYDLAVGATVLTIYGFMFKTPSPFASNILSVAFNQPDVNCNVVLSNNSMLVCELSSSGLNMNTSYPLTAVVTNNGGDSGEPVQVATVVNPPVVITPSPLVEIPLSSSVVNISGLYIDNGRMAPNTQPKVTLKQGTAVHTCTLVSFGPTWVVCNPAPGTLVNATLQASIAANGVTSQYADVFLVVNNPVITLRQFDVVPTPTSLTIYGSHFTSTNAGDNLQVTLLQGPMSSQTTVPCPVVPGDTSYTMIVCSLQVGYNLTLGAVYATVQLNGGSSGTRVQIANVVTAPSIRANTNYDLAVGATSFTILGSNFKTNNPDPANVISVSLNIGNCTILNVSLSVIVCAVSGLSDSDIGQTLTGVVYTNGGNSGNPVPVAELISNPIISPTMYDLARDAPYVTIHGSNFLGPNVAPWNVLSVQLSQDGGTTQLPCTPLNPTETSVTCQLNTLLSVGQIIQARVQSNGGFSDWGNAAVAVPEPMIDLPYFDLAYSAPLLTIYGNYFVTNGSALPDVPTVYLTQGLDQPRCVVNSYNATVIVCYITGLALGNLSATVWANGGPSATQNVATIVSAAQIDFGDYDFAENALTLTFTGENFITSNPLNVNDITVTLSQHGEGSNPTCDITKFTATVIECSVESMKFGILYASVRANGGYSDWQQVANITVSPSVVFNNYDQAASVALVTILGAGFQTWNPHPLNTLTVLLSSGTCDLLDLSYSQIVCALVGSELGPLTVEVFNNFGHSDANDVQIATVVPDPSVEDLVVSAILDYAIKDGSISLVVNGDNFKTAHAVPNTNPVVTLFQDGVSPDPVCTFIMATIDKVYCSISGLGIGWLNASVAANGGSSANPKVIANIVPNPIVSEVTTDLSRDAKLITISGEHFTSPNPSASLAFVIQSETTTYPCTLNPESVVDESFTCTRHTFPLMHEGNLTAIVSFNGDTSNTTQIATVIAQPVITQRNYDQTVTAPLLTILGSNLITPNRDVNDVFQVSLTPQGSCVSISGSDSMVVCTLAEPFNFTGVLHAEIINANGGRSLTSHQVATIVPNPSFDATQVYDVALNAPLLTIYGADFVDNHTAPWNQVTVDLKQTNSTPTCIIDSVSFGQIICTLDGDSLVDGVIQASVSTNSGSSGYGEVAIVYDGAIISQPHNYDTAVNAPLLTIYGSGFDTAHTHPPVAPQVTFTSTDSTASTNCTLEYYSASLIVCQLEGLTIGDLSAEILMAGGESVVAVVAHVIAPPSITEQLNDLAVTATFLTIHGDGFQTPGLQLPTNILEVTLWQDVNNTVSTPLVNDTLSNSTGLNTTSPNTNTTTCTILSHDLNNIVCQVSNLVYGPVFATVYNNAGWSTTTQVSNIVPDAKIQPEQYDVAQSADIIYIFGNFFNTTNPYSDATIYVTLSSGECIITEATLQMIVCQVTPGSLDLGVLTAQVATNFGTGSSVTQVVNVVPNPTITPIALDWAINTVHFVIDGIGFVSNNTAPWYSGATIVLSQAGVEPSPTCQVTLLEATVVECTVSGLGLGFLNATITSSGASSNSQTVANIVPDPSVTEITYDLADSASFLTINGDDFLSEHPSNGPAVITLYDSNGDAFPCGNSTNTPTAFFCVLEPNTLPLGVVQAVVSYNGGNSGAPTAVATIVPNPSLNENLNSIGSLTEAHAFPGSNILTTNPAPWNQISVVFSPSITQCEVVDDTLNSVTCELSNLTEGYLTAVVFANGGYSSPVVVGYVLPPPQVTFNDYVVAINATLLTIIGERFNGDNSTGNSIELSQASGNTINCEIASATSTEIVCLSPSNLELGPLYARVQSFNAWSPNPPVQVAEIVNAPIVNEFTVDLAINALTLTVIGQYFNYLDQTRDSILLFQQSGNPVCSSLVVYQDLTPPSPTGVITCKPSGLILGPLYAVVFSNDGPNGNPIQVANVVPAPIIYSAVLVYPEWQPEIQISGRYFNQILPREQNIVTLTMNPSISKRDTLSSLQKVPCVVTTATDSQLTCTLLTLTQGPVYASVISNGGSSGSAVKVAVIVPDVESSCKPPRGAPDALNPAYCNCHSGYAPSNIMSTDCEVTTTCPPQPVNSESMYAKVSSSRPQTQFVDDKLYISQSAPIVSGRRSYHIGFTAPVLVNSTDIAGAPGSTSCMYPGVMWSKTLGDLDCVEIFEGVMPWTQNGFCGFVEDVTGSTVTTVYYRANLVTTYTDVYVSRGVVKQRVTSNTYLVTVSFARQTTYTADFNAFIIDANSIQGVQVYVVGNSLFDASSRKVWVTIGTTVSWPYVFPEESLAGVFSSAIGLPSTAATITMVPDSSFDQSATCTLNSPTDCAQQWIAEINLDSDPSICNIVGQFTFSNSTLWCRDSNVTTCPGNTDASLLSFGLKIGATNLCVDQGLTLDVDTSLATFADPKYSQPNSNFQTYDLVYLTATIVDAVGTIDSVTLNDLRIVDSVHSTQDVLYSLSGSANVDPTAAKFNVEEVTSSVSPNTPAIVYLNFQLGRAVFPNTVGLLGSSNIFSQSLSVQVTVDILYHGNQKRTVQMNMESSKTSPTSSILIHVVQNEKDMEELSQTELSHDRSSSSFLTLNSILLIVTSLFGMLLL